MQTTPHQQTTVATLFSRERRRQRMLQFLEAFERRSWRCAPELPFLLPLTKADHTGSDLAAPHATQR
jgi:hypothetical protein